MEYEYSPPQLWLRDPYEYLPTILDIPWQTVRTVWTADFLKTTGASPRKVLNYLIPGRSWEALALDAKGAYFMTGDNTEVQWWERWTYGAPMKRLMELFASGKRFVLDFPGMDVPVADRDEFAKYYHRFQIACPQSKPHIHGTVGYSKGIGMGPYSVDFDLSHLPDRKSLQLPNGRLVRPEELSEADWLTHRYWTRILGYTSLLDMDSYDEMIRFEMRSMSWAAVNWEKISDTKIKGVPHVKDLMSFTAEVEESSYMERLAEMTGSDEEYIPKTELRSRYGWGRRKALPTDRIACDTCSLADVCKAFRQGSVCAVPNTEGDSLRKRFGTRSSSAIVSGLQELMQVNADRIKTAIDSEDIEEKGLDPELTKLIDKTIGHGEKVAKLIDPRLRPGPAAQVLINNQNGSPQHQVGANATPQQLTATVIRELESQGMKREDITPKIINDHVNVLARMSANGDLNDDEEYDEYVDAEIEQ